MDFEEKILSVDNALKSGVNENKIARLYNVSPEFVRRQRLFLGISKVDLRVNSTIPAEEVARQRQLEMDRSYVYRLVYNTEYANKNYYKRRIKNKDK